MPNDRRDLTKGGKLAGAAGHVAAHRPADRLPRRRRPTPTSPSQDMKDLHTYGNVVRRPMGARSTTRDIDGTPPFDANALAKAARRTPFKRPENGLFRPGIELPRVLLRRDRRHQRRHRGRRGVRRLRRVFKLDAGGPSADARRAARSFYHGDRRTPASTTSRSGRENQIVVRRGRAATRCTPSATRSTPATLFDVDADYSKPGAQPVRFLAEGRDASATIDSGLSRAGRRLPERRRQRDHRHPRLRRRPDARRAPRRQGADAVRGRLARVLHAAARRQHHLGDPPGARRARRLLRGERGQPGGRRRARAPAAPAGQNGADGLRPARRGRAAAPHGARLRRGRGRAGGRGARPRRRRSPTRSCARWARSGWMGIPFPEEVGGAGGNSLAVRGRRRGAHARGLLGGHHDVRAHVAGHAADLPVRLARSRSRAGCPRCARARSSAPSG